MKKIITGLFSAVLVVSGGAAFAQTSDDKKWVSQCIMDNKDEGASPEVVFNYCVCMNDKMDETETRSITQWEKANPTAMKDCERQSGWK